MYADAFVFKALLKLYYDKMNFFSTAREAITMSNTYRWIKLLLDSSLPFNK